MVEFGLEFNSIGGDFLGKTKRLSTKKFGGSGEFKEIKVFQAKPLRKRFILDKARRDDDIIFGGRAIKERIGLLARPTEDFDVFTKKQPVEKSLDFMMGLITDWDLESDEKPIPCNQKTKEQYIEYLLILPVKDGEETVNLGRKIVQFARDINNFTKN